MAIVNDNEKIEGVLCAGVCYVGCILGCDNWNYDHADAVSAVGALALASGL